MCHASHQWSRTGCRGNCRGKKSSMLLSVFSFWWFWHAIKPTDLMEVSLSAFFWRFLKIPVFKKKFSTLVILRSLHWFFISLIMHYLPYILATYISILHMLIRILHIPILLFPLHLSATISASKSPIAVSTIPYIIKNMHSIRKGSTQLLLCRSPHFALPHSRRSVIT